jgi:HEAT repeat protein
MRRLFAIALLSLLAPAACAGDFEDKVSYQGRTLHAWLIDLRGNDVEARLLASRVLRDVGPEADGATAALLLCLKSHAQVIRDTDDLVVRARVAAALARMGPKQVPVLAVALGLEDAGLSFGAARALAALGPQAKPAAPHLARQLKSLSPRVRIVSALALYRIDKRPAAVAALRKELSGSGDDLAWAAWALEQCGPDAAPAVPELVAQLTNRSEFIRRYAFLALESIGQPAVAPLVKALDSKQPRQRVEAAEALGRIGPEAEAAVPALIGLTQTAPPGPRAAAARALGRIGSADRKTLDALQKSLRDSDAVVRREAALALQRLGPRAASLAAPLSEALRDSDRPTRRAAAAALARIGTPAVKPLLALLNDSDDLIRRQALDCLTAQAPEDALAALIGIARDPHDVLRPRAVEALASFGRPAATTLAALLADGRVRGESAAALARLGADAAPARRALIDTLAQAEPAVLQDVIHALGEIGGTESAAALVKLYDDQDAPHLAVLSALARMPGAAKEWVPVARKALKDDRPLVRLEALAALAVAGGESKPAIEDVTARLKDDNAVVRQSAGQVLVLLGETKPVLARAKELLTADDAADRRVALGWLAWLGPQAKDVQVSVRDRLEDADASVRLAAAAALTEIDPDDDSPTSILAALLKDESPKASLLRVVSRRGARARGLVDPLTRLADDGEMLPLRLEAARALGAVGPEAKSAAPALLRLMLALERLPDANEMGARDRVVLKGDLAVRRGRGLDEADVAADVDAAVKAIRSRGLEAIDELGRVLYRLRETEQRELLDDFARIGGAVVPELSKQLESESAERRRLAARVLGRLGKEAKDAAPALRAALKDPDPSVAVESARALFAISGETEAVVPVLRASLAAPGDVAVRAAAGLAEMGTASKPALEELLLAARSREARLRHQAARALGVCDGDVKQVRPALQRLRLDDADAVRVAAALALARLEDSDPTADLVQVLRFGEDRQARLAAIAALSERPEKSKAALPALKTALTESSPELRTAAALALQKIAGKDAPVTDALLGVASSAPVRPAVRAAALRGLAEADGGKRARYAVTDLARDASTPAEVREAARAVLAKWK